MILSRTQALDCRQTIGVRRLPLPAFEGIDKAGCSPLFADLRGLPPMLIHAGSEEILPSDSERLAQRDWEAGVAVQLRRFEGVGHVLPFHAGWLHDADDSIRAAGNFIEHTRSSKSGVGIE